MNILALKTNSGAAHYWHCQLCRGVVRPSISGWIVGMPLTSGPVIFFLLSHRPFAANASFGRINGGLSLAAYAKLIHGLPRGSLSCNFRSLFVFYRLLLQSATLPLLPIFAMVCLAIVGLLLMPRDTVIKDDESKPSRWDIPIRVLIGTSFILLLTGIAPFIGARLTGLLTTIPLYVTILAIFAHRDQGPAAAAHVLRGLLYGMFAFIGFFITLNLLIEQAGLAVAFGAATLTALIVQGTSLFVLRQLHK